LRTILNDVVALHGAEFGNIQLAIDDDTLALIEHRGFDQQSLRSLRRVARDSGAASARAFAARKPVVIPDLSKDRALAPYHQLANTMGVRAMQSTPFIAARGRCVGVVSPTSRTCTRRVRLKWRRCSNTALSPPTSSSARLKVRILLPSPTHVSGG
jgi:GAF domain-containing protein